MEYGLNEWDTPRPPSFCEGKLWNGKVFSGIDEFSSGLSGFFIIAIALAGISQKRLEVITKMMYAALFASGVGTVMLHWHRIAAFNLADVYPLLLTLAFGLIAFFDEIVFEIKRRRGPSGEILPDQPHEYDTLRTATDALFFIAGMIYLVIGLVLMVYSTYEGIFGLYFGIPFGVFSIGGTVFVCIREKKRGTPKYKTLAVLSAVSITTGLLSIVFKVIDSGFCNSVTIWFFPHSMWHILITYSTHGFITFLSYHRIDNYAPYNRTNIRISWYFKFFPYLIIPPADEIERVNGNHEMKESCNGNGLNPRFDEEARDFVPDKMFSNPGYPRLSTQESLGARSHPTRSSSDSVSSHLYDYSVRESTDSTTPVMYPKVH